MEIKYGMNGTVFVSAAAAPGAPMMKSHLLKPNSKTTTHCGLIRKPHKPGRRYNPDAWSPHVKLVPAGTPQDEGTCTRCLIARGGAGALRPYPPYQRAGR